MTTENAGDNDYFKSQVYSAGPEYDYITVSSGGDTGSYFKYVSPSSQSPQYDKSGNLISDWRWTYTWDAENRLIKMETQSSAVSAGVPDYTLEFVYDAQSRRIRKTVKYGSYVYNDWKYVYNGWNLAAELDAKSGDALKRSYLWGLDVSGSHQGAGGVGGLLMIRKHGSGASDQLVCYDGNGNITALVNAATQAISAEYTLSLIHI